MFTKYVLSPEVTVDWVSKKKENWLKKKELRKKERSKRTIKKRDWEIISSQTPSNHLIPCWRFIYLFLDCMFLLGGFVNESQSEYMN